LPAGRVSDYCEESSNLLLGKRTARKLISLQAARQRLGEKLDPALREWADRVIIPALAREFSAEQHKKQIAEPSESVAQFETTDRLSARGTL
jgi:hypothetical protein